MGSMASAPYPGESSKNVESDRSLCIRCIHASLAALVETRVYFLSVESNQNVESEIAFLFQEIRKIIKIVATI